MSIGQEVKKFKKLLDALYSKCSCVHYEVAFDFAVRAFQRIPEGNVGLYHCNFDLYVENCADRLGYDVLGYYLSGKGKKEHLSEDVFPIINTLSRNAENAVGKELREMFSKIYNSIN